MNLPTLEQQIATSKLSDEECVNLLLGRNHWYLRLNFWIFRFAPFLWRVLNFNWWCIWCGKNHFYLKDNKCYRQYKGG